MVTSLLLRPPAITPPPPPPLPFDFELERKILAEAEKENPNWNKLGLENFPRPTAKPVSRMNSGVDPVVANFIATGLNREAAVPIAVAKYGDHPLKPVRIEDA